MSNSIRETKSDFASPVPPLASGDRLDADQYWNRYQRSPEVNAERIGGRVYLMSPLRAASHGDPHALLSGWLFQYALNYDDLVVSDNATIRLNQDNDPQPDLCLRKKGGTSSLVDDYIQGPPELIVEVAGSSASYDFGEKKDAYESAGVQEYLIFETFEGKIAWWQLNQAKYESIEQVDGIYRSNVFAGLWLDADALRCGDAKKLIATLNGGMA
jgi:Uma2 family endonuclease